MASIVVVITAALVAFAANNKICVTHSFPIITECVLNNHNDLVCYKYERISGSSTTETCSPYATIDCVVDTPVNVLIQTWVSDCDSDSSGPRCLHQWAKLGDEHTVSASQCH